MAEDHNENENRFTWHHTDSETGQTVDVEHPGSSSENAAAHSGNEEGSRKNGRNIRNSKKTGKRSAGSGPLGTQIGKVAIVLAVFVIIGLFGNCYYNVSEQEQAVLTMFGKVVRTDTAGLYFKLPLIQQVHKVDMTTHGIGIGYELDNYGQNITIEDEGVMITSDFNFVDIDFYLEYKVNDPVAYLYNTKEPERIMKNIALACIRATVIDFPVDDVITIGKTQIQSEVREKLQAELQRQNVGISVVNISVQDAEPPTPEIVQAFKAVETAKQGKETALNNAKKYQSEKIPEAEAAADKILQQAEAAKEARIAEAQGQVERFNQVYEQYRKYPLITKQRMFYETIEDVLPDVKVVITDGNTQQLMPIGSFNSGSAGTVSSQSSAGADHGAE